MSIRLERGNHGAEILLRALGDPGRTLAFTIDEWDLLLRVARANRLLARLAVCLEEHGLMARLPAKVVDHLAAAQVIAEHRQRAASWEISRIQRALASLQIPIVLLKGGAYILAGLPPARGRLLSDVDLLVSATHLEQAEKALLAGGWESVKLEEYDQRYYRTWMHELPPLRHPDRGLEVDIHHTISPLTSRLNPDPEKLVRDSQQLENGQLRVLQPVDMVLHSAVHLFYDGEFINGLRDLVDLADLLAHFGLREGFWRELLSRSREQDLQRPLYYAMRYTERLLETAVPASATADIASAAPPRLALALMDQLVFRGLVPDHPDYPRHGTALAQWLLYVRSHWLRMPPVLLLKHLMRKQIMRWKRRKAGTGATVQG